MHQLKEFVVVDYYILKNNSKLRIKINNVKKLNNLEFAAAGGAEEVVLVEAGAGAGATTAEPSPITATARPSSPAPIEVSGSSTLSVSCLPSGISVSDSHVAASSAGVVVVARAVLHAQRRADPGGGPAVARLQEHVRGRHAVRDQRAGAAAPAGPEHHGHRPCGGERFSAQPRQAGPREARRILHVRARSRTAHG